MLKIETGSENQILRNKSVPAKSIDKEQLGLIKEMKETLIAEGGAGLAAPQVGRNVRLILANLSTLSKHKIVVMINPEIISFSEESEIVEEGCLSLPDLFVQVERSTAITVKYLDEKGKEQVKHLKGMNARIVQHEIDHLDGVLICDFLSTKSIAAPEKVN